MYNPCCGTVVPYFSSRSLSCTKLFYSCPCQTKVIVHIQVIYRRLKSQYFRLFTSPTFDYLFILLNLVSEFSCIQI